MRRAIDATGVEDARSFRCYGYEDVATCDPSFVVKTFNIFNLRVY